MFRFIVIAIAAAALSLSCSKDTKTPEADPFSPEMTLPEAKPLNPAESAEATTMFSAVNAVTGAVGQLNDSASVRDSGDVYDAILNNCKVVSDQTTTGNHTHVDSHSESLPGKNCPIDHNRSSDADSSGGANSLRIFGSTQQTLAVVGEPVLTLVDLRNFSARAGVAIAFDSSNSAKRLRMASNATGTITFATHGNLEFFQKIRTDVQLSPQTGAITSGKITSAQGAFVENQWYIVRLHVLYTNGQAQFSCYLNGVDITSDPVCGSSAITKVRSALSEYVK